MIIQNLLPIGRRQFIDAIQVNNQTFVYQYNYSCSLGIRRDILSYIKVHSYTHAQKI